MSLRINTNIAAMNSYRSLTGTDKSMSSSLEKLSSGYRINKAADDAAGLSISQGLKSQIGGLTVAARNAQDGVNVAQTADGSLGEVESILQRMRDLAVQAANDGSQDDDAKAASQAEFSQLRDELSTIASTTKFGNQSLLGGSYAGSFQVGANAGEVRTLDLSGANSSLFGSSGVTGFDASGLGLGSLSLTGAGKTFASALGQVDFSAATAPGADDTVAITATNGSSKTVDLTGVTWNNAGTAAAAKENQAAVQKAYDTALKGTGVNATVDAFGGITFATDSADVTAVTSTAYGTLTQGGGTDASAAITAVDKAIKGVSSARSYIGAVQNRLEHTINNINVTTENLSASNSAIVDTDMAQEMVSFTRAQILSQAGTSMLAQANSASQNVLRLLQ